MLRIVMHSALITLALYEKEETIKKVYVVTSYKIWGRQSFPAVPMGNLTTRHGLTHRTPVSPSDWPGQVRNRTLVWKVAVKGELCASRSLVLAVATETLAFGWWLCWLADRQTWVVSQDAWTESGNKELAQISIGICNVGTLTALPDYLLI